MSDQIEFEYDDKKRSAVIKFGKGRTMRLSNVTEQQARDFVEKHAGEFQRRDCVLHTAGAFVTREG